MEPDLRSQTPSGGLIVMVRTDTHVAARALAVDLHAELAIGGNATAGALDRFLDAVPQPSRPPDLDELAEAMRRAEAVRDGTRTATAERLARSFNTRLAIHPDTIRRAAGELLDARAAVAAAENRALRRVHRRHTTLRAAGIAAAVGAVAAGVLVEPVAAAIVAAGALVLAGLGYLATRIADQVRRSRPDLKPRLLDALGRAERRWVQVAGHTADPLDVDAVVRRYEPQQYVVASLVGESPAVRAADRLAVQRRAAWVAAWRAAVGERGPLAGAELVGLLRSDETQIWLDGDQTLDPGPPTLVVADPFVDLTDEQARSLHRRLVHLPPGHRVVVVLEPGPAPRVQAAREMAPSAETTPQPEGVS